MKISKRAVMSDHGGNLTAKATITMPGAGKDGA